MPPSKLTFREQMNGFPVWQIIVTSLVRFAEPIAFTSLFPYVYFMVRDFHVSDTEADIAKYVGYLSSSFAFCQFLSSIHWGHLADVIGRKKVLIIGLISTALSLLLFGFSKSYYTALLARCLMGFFNGNVLVIRTVLGEIAVHKRHQAMAFSTLPLLWQFGSIVGPFIGGLLTNVDPDVDYSPNETIYYKMVSPLLNQNQYTSLLLQNLNTNYPYALSNIVVSMGLFFCTLSCFLFFEETHEYLKFQKDVGVELGDRLIKFIGYNPPIRPWHRGYPHELPSMSRAFSSGSSSLPVRRSSLSELPEALAERRPLLQDNDGATYLNDDDDDDVISIDSSKSVGSDRSVHSIGLITRRQSLALIHTYSKRSNLINSDVERGGKSYEWGVLFKSQVFYSIFANFAISLTNIVVDEFLPVFLAHKTQRIVNGDLKSPLISKFPFKIVGGLSFDPQEVGNLLSLTGTVGVLLVIFVYPFIDRTFNPVKSFRFFILMTPFVYFAIPLLVFTLPPNTPSMAYTKASLYTVVFVKVLSNSICFPQIMLLIHRVSPAKNRAFINGTTISLTAFARCLGPLIWGYIMSWSDSHEKGWLTWWSMSLVAILSTIPAFLLKEGEDEEDTAVEDRGAVDGDEDEGV